MGEVRAQLGRKWTVVAAKAVKSARTFTSSNYEARKFLVTCKTVATTFVVLLEYLPS